MNNNKAVIPLYLNTSITKNLFTIVIKEFVEIESLIATNELAVKVHAPLSEFMEPCDRYIQGNFDLELSREMVRKTINAQISKEIEVLVDLKKLLNENGLVKEIYTSDDILNIKQNDFIEFVTEIKPNPLIEYIEDLIKMMELDITFHLDKMFQTGKDEDIEIKRQILALLKKDMDEWKQSKCIKFISEGIGDSDIKVVVPLEIKYMTDNIDYMNNAKVTVLGKVVRISLDRDDKSINLLSGTCFDYLSEEHFKGFKDRLFTKASSFNNFDTEILNPRYPLIEIVPIALYV